MGDKYILSVGQLRFKFYLPAVSGRKRQSCPVGFIVQRVKKLPVWVFFPSSGCPIDYKNYTFSLLSLKDNYTFILA
jgi:hypothetical protein